MKGLTNILWWICSWIAIFIFFYLLGTFLDNTYFGIFLFIILAGSYYYLVFRNQNARVKKANTKLLDYLIEGESIIVKGSELMEDNIFETFFPEIVNRKNIKLCQGVDYKKS